jgi:photosystem II stability/assembly factor-like uncharacterized protein
VKATVWLCAGAVLVAGCGGAASTSSVSTSSSPCPSVTSAPVGGWRAVHSCTRQTLYDVACLSALRCEAVGAAGTILATADGGLTWRAQANPLQGSRQILYQIACAPPGSCYVIARPDTILVTHDGGATWSSHVLPVGVPPGADLTSQTCVTGAPNLAGVYALCRLGLLDIACVSARVCYAVGSTSQSYGGYPISSTQHVAPSSIWLTRDGGASWTRQSIPLGVVCNGDCAQLYFYPLEWVTCLGSGLCRAGGGNFLCSNCGFVNAVLVTRGLDEPWACSLPGANCAWFALDAADCPTSTLCYGVQTTDPLLCCNYSSSFGNGTTVGRSTDGGVNWDGIGPAVNRSVLNDIACPAALTCYLAGSDGAIARITNGTTYTAQASPTTSNLYGITCTDTTACYAVGDHGTILIYR